MNSIRVNRDDWFDVAINTKGQFPMVQPVQPPSPVLFQAHAPAAILIPFLGSIAAGWPEERQQEPGCLSLSLEQLGIQPRPCAFALKVLSDAMIGRHVVPGDVLIFDHRLPPRDGDIVAVLVNNQTILRTVIMHQGRMWLRAENPKYAKFIPADGLVIEGVMTVLVRRPR